ncbi:cyclic nucleotide-binding domain-containing protein [Leptolyngbya sp. CCY15150]|uniref:cyclic nucleotide-binding domain-containing protein n=1 Tax=Leptolyngbya sp. CCY15150 TaxID=2767772 RepID=UPI0019513E6D|nr:cyclic nucleotide-binding domain-containing protein [Leptolyngbya sp. CCY15150]
MSPKHHFFSLKLSPPFDRLNDPELILLANLAQERHYEPGSLVYRGGRPLSYLYITIQGSLCVQTSPPIRLPRVFGEESLLFNRAIAHDLHADREGATCLLFRKENFFTMVYECPSLLLGFCHTTVDTPSLFIPSYTT